MPDGSPWRVGCHRGQNEMLNTLINNVDVGKIATTVEDGRRDTTSLRKTVRLHGEWSTSPGARFQFRTMFQFEGGSKEVEMDSPSFLGGKGRMAGPTDYCVAGMASCFALTFAILASRQDVHLSELAIDAECVVNFAKYLDVTEAPVVEGVKFRVVAKSATANREKLLELVKLTEERCPAVFMLVNKIKVQTELA